MQGFMLAPELVLLFLATPYQIPKNAPAYMVIHTEHPAHQFQFRAMLGQHLTSIH